MKWSPWIALVAWGCTPTVVEPAEPVQPEEPPRVKLEVTFTTLEVIDDKESGSGDWVVALTVDGTALGDPITGEADFGEAVDLENKKAQSEGFEESHTLLVTAKVQEWDGGFDGTMEYIGEDTHTYDKSNGFGVGARRFEWDVDEGHVKLNYLVVRRD